MRMSLMMNRQMSDLEQSHRFVLADCSHLNSWSCCNCEMGLNMTVKVLNKSELVLHRIVMALHKIVMELNMIEMVLHKTVMALHKIVMVLHKIVMELSMIEEVLHKTVMAIHKIAMELHTIESVIHQSMEHFRFHWSSLVNYIVGHMMMIQYHFLH